MEDDICTYLSYEVKKEIADQYFGFRKLIEEDKEALQDRIRRQERILLKEIGFNLVRIYILLRDEGLIREFLQLAGLEERIFYDDYFLQSPTIEQRVFAGVKTSGLTRAGRFSRLLLDCYENLEKNVADYREQYIRLLEEQASIEEEIKVFYRRHDLSCILDFLRRMDEAGRDSPTVLEWGNGKEERGESMAARMRIRPPEPLDNVLLRIPPLTPLPRIRGQLRALAEKAYELNGKRLPLP